MIRGADDLRLGYVTEGHLIDSRLHRLPGVETVRLPSVDAYLSGEAPEVDALITTAETGTVLSMLNPSFSVVIPEGAKAKVPLVFAVPMTADLDRLVNTWIRLAQSDGTIDDVYAHWILGETLDTKRRRWSMVRRCLGLGRAGLEPIGPRCEHPGPRA